MNTELTLPICEVEERRIVGAILEGNAQAYNITTQNGISSADFFLASHRLIFSALADMADAGEGIDLITAAAKLRDRGQLAQVGGEAYLASLLDGLVFEPPSFVSCAKRVRDSVDRRRLIAACQATTSHAAESGARVTECLDLLNEHLLPIQMGSTRNSDGTDYLG